MQKYKKVKKTSKKAKMQKRLLKSLTNHQGVNTLGKKMHKDVQLNHSFL